MGRVRRVGEGDARRRRARAAPHQVQAARSRVAEAAERRRSDWPASRRGLEEDVDLLDRERLGLDRPRACRSSRAPERGIVVAVLEGEEVPRAHHRERLLEHSAASSTMISRNFSRYSGAFIEGLAALGGQLHQPHVREHPIPPRYVTRDGLGADAADAHPWTTAVAAPRAPRARRRARAATAAPRGTRSSPRSCPGVRPRLEPSFG